MLQWMMLLLPRRRQVSTRWRSAFCFLRFLRFPRFLGCVCVCFFFCSLLYFYQWQQRWISWRVFCLRCCTCFWWVGERRMPCRMLSLNRMQLSPLRLCVPLSQLHVLLHLAGDSKCKLRPKASSRPHLSRWNPRRKPVAARRKQCAHIWMQCEVMFLCLSFPIMD